MIHYHYIIYTLFNKFSQKKTTKKHGTAIEHFILEKYESQMTQNSFFIPYKVLVTLRCICLAQSTPSTELWFFLKTFLTETLRRLPQFGSGSICEKRNVAS